MVGAKAFQRTPSVYPKCKFKLQIAHLSGNSKSLTNYLTILFTGSAEMSTVPGGLFRE